MASCPWCNAPRDTGSSCPKCGANYAKAEQIRRQGRAVEPAPAAAAAAPVAAEAPPEAVRRAMLAAGIQDGPPSLVDDPELELKFCIAAIPAALAIAVVLQAAAPFLMRTFFAMPVHELGHAMAAWFTGHWAIPTLWKTMMAETRGFATPLVLLGLIGFLMYRGHQAGQRGVLVLGAVLLAVQAAGTLFVSQKTADMLKTFGGDGFGMVLAAALMASFFFGKDTNLYKGSLRWGFVFIGACAFVNMFAVWWGARSDFGRIPFGEIEGVGLSDATKLVDLHDWEAGQMVRRFVALGVASLVALAAVYAWGVRDALQRVRAFSSAPAGENSSTSSRRGPA